MSDAAYVIVVDDDAAVAWSLEQALVAEGYRVKVVAEAKAAQRAIRRERPDAVLTDIRMPGVSGLELLEILRGEYRHLPVIVMTAHGTMETAVEAVKQGAYDYLPKPIDLSRLLEVVAAAIGDRSIAAVSRQPEDSDPTSAMIGSTPAMQEVYRRIAAAANTDLGVLITGPSGSGKELVARALHRHGKRGDKPFHAVNCGALPDNLVESELFGHEAGSFTDARERKIGRIEAADGGTLFLDEIGELPMASQVKLLRFLEDQSFTRVGDVEEIQVDVRIIAATNRDIAAMVEGGAFREDLAYRLKVLTVGLPPLKDRLDDLPDLARHFLGRISRQLSRELAITDSAMNALGRYSWPGNVRELRHVVEEAAVLATGGVIDVGHLSISPEPAQAEGDNASHDFTRSVAIEVGRLANQVPGEVQTHLVDAVEVIMIREALARTNGNQLRSAELLGMNRITLKKRMDQLGVSK